MSALFYLSFLSPLLAFSSPTPEISARTPQAIDPTIGFDGTAPSGKESGYYGIPYPPGLDYVNQNEHCQLTKATNLWAGIAGLQAPGTSGDPNVTVKPFTEPQPPLCDLIARLRFANGPGMTVGNTQTLALPVGHLYVFSYALDPTRTQQVKRITIYDGTVPSEPDPNIPVDPLEKQGYVNVHTEYPSAGPAGGFNGTLAVNLLPSAGGDPSRMMNMHAEIEFTEENAAGQIGLFSTAKGPADAFKGPVYWGNTLWPWTGLIDDF